MSGFEIFVLVLAVAVVGFQIWLTARVFKSGLYDKKQKVWQTQIIWLIPVIGAGLVFSILQEDARAQRPSPNKLER
ncbi:MAG TPA: hypothetical protein VGM56_21940 [Byssovorax sp.]|jgi:hypothetical protein